jgi:hypothetical protein
MQREEIVMDAQKQFPQDLTLTPISFPCSDGSAP